MIGDMIDSSSLRRFERPEAQREFAELISDLNHRFRKQLLARFVITLGDEFQGLLRDGSVIPQLVRMVELYPHRDFRLGFGFGTIDTPIPYKAINVDGPALHNARAAIDRAKLEDRPGGVFVGFGPQIDRIAYGYARILRHVRERMTAQQRRVLQLMSTELRQNEVADQMGITKQAVSQHVAAVGWPAYLDAEIGWSAVFELLPGRDVK